MPFKNPSMGSVHIDEGRYIVEVTDLQDTVHEEYGDGIRWIFNVYDPLDRNTLVAEEWWQTTGVSVSAKAKSGKWLRALLNRELDMQADTGESLTAEALGKKAIALIADNDNGYSAIVSMSPLKAKAGAKAEA